MHNRVNSIDQLKYPGTISQTRKCSCYTVTFCYLPQYNQFNFPKICHFCTLPINPSISLHPLFPVTWWCWSLSQRSPSQRQWVRATFIEKWFSILHYPELLWKTACLHPGWTARTVLFRSLKNQAINISFISLKFGTICFPGESPASSFLEGSALTLSKMVLM